MVIALWSPKGGSGTSVCAAACAVVLARRGGARLADLRGDQPAVLGLSEEPVSGLRDWLALGPGAPADALELLAVRVRDGLSLLPADTADVSRALPEAGAALAVALRDDHRPVVVDVGVPYAPALEALVEVADVSIVVLRACYVALRRARFMPLTSQATGALVVEEHGRALGRHDVADTLGIPVLATIVVHPATARAVDAGLFGVRPPESVARPIRKALDRIGGHAKRGRAA